MRNDYYGLVELQATPFFKLEPPSHQIPTKNDTSWPWRYNKDEAHLGRVGIDINSPSDVIAHMHYATSMLLQVMQSL